MYYKIKKTDLEELFNVEFINLKVNKLMVNKFIEEGNVFKKESDDVTTEQEKKIAYLIINYDEICLDFIEEGKVSNEMHLLAALMSESTEIVIKFSNKVLEEKLKEKYNIKGINFIEKSNLTINEDFLIGLTKDGWDNKGFIIKKLSSFRNDYTSEEFNIQLAIELVSYIPEKEWSDEDFVSMFVENNNINKLIELAINKEKNKTLNVLYNEKLLDKIVESKNKNLFNRYVQIYCELTNTNSYTNISISKTKNVHASEELIEKEKKFTFCIGKYFKQLEYAKKAIKIISADYFYLFDIQLRKDKKFEKEYVDTLLELLNQKLSNKYGGMIWNFMNLIGAESLKDKRVQTFALQNGDRINGKDHEPLLAAEIIKGTTEEIVGAIASGNQIDFLWEYLSKEQKQKKVIVTELIKKNPKIYNKMSEELRFDKDLFKIYYSQLKEKDLLKDFKVGKISKEFFNSFTEEEIIDLIILVPEFILEEKFPEKYFDNVNVMSHTTTNIDLFNRLYKENERAKKTLNKVFNDKNLSISMLKRTPGIFKYISEKLKSDMEVLEEYVKNTYNYENLPAKVYLNKNLLLHIIKVRSNFIQKIPQEFFKDQDFLLKIFEKIDKGEISKLILNSLPTVINEILNTTSLKEGEYYDFFSKIFTNMNLTENLQPGKNLKIKKTKI